jgi:putative isomerase
VVTPGAAYLYGIFIWDTGFHVLGLLHGGPKARQLAVWGIAAMLAAQDGSGRVIRVLRRDGPWDVPELGTQAPGILTYAANRLYETARPGFEQAALRAQLADFYPRLARFHEWFFARTDQGRGLCRWHNEDSGWDTSPRWDGGVRESLDLNCWHYLDELELGQMARTLGKNAEATAWEARAAALRERIRRYHWNEALGVYNDTGPDGNPTSVITPVIVWPLWVGIATPEQASRTLAHVVDPKELGTPWPLACAAANLPVYNPRDYWRGPTWINLSWVAFRGLERYGFRREAAALREKTLDLIARTPVLYEYYDSQKGDGLGSADYGWTSALYIDLVMDKEGTVRPLPGLRGIPSESPPLLPGKPALAPRRY